MFCGWAPVGAERLFLCQGHMADWGALGFLGVCVTQLQWPNTLFLWEASASGLHPRGLEVCSEPGVNLVLHQSLWLSPAFSFSPPAPFCPHVPRVAPVPPRMVTFVSVMTVVSDGFVPINWSRTLGLPGAETGVIGDS